MAKNPRIRISGNTNLQSDKLGSINWDKFKESLNKISTGVGDEYFVPVEGLEIRNPARDFADSPWGANQESYNDPYLLFEHLRRCEPILRDISDGALRSLLSLDEEIIASDENNPTHIQHCNWLRNYLTKGIKINGQRGSWNLKSVLWESIDYGTVYLSLPWENVDGYTLPCIESIPQWAFRYFYLDKKARPFFYDTSKSQYGILFEGEDALIIRLNARDPWRPHGWGLIASNYRILYLYNYVYALAAEGMERFDLPWIIATMPQDAEQQADDIIECDTRVAGKIIYEVPPAVMDAANPEAASAVTAESYKLEFKEMTRATHDIFIPWLERLEASLSFSYTNQSLSTQQSATGSGSFAQSETHQESAGKSEAGWCALIETGIQEIINRIWAKNFADEIPPTYHIVTEAEKEWGAPELTALGGFIQQFGEQLGIEANWVRNKLGAPDPKPDSVLLKPTQTALPSYGSYGQEMLPAFHADLAVDSTIKDDERKMRTVISASDEYAIKVARKVIPALKSGLEDLAKVYREPVKSDTPEEAQARKREMLAKIEDRINPVIDALQKTGESGDFRHAKKEGFDLFNLTGAIYNAAITGWLAGYKDEGNKIWQQEYGASMAVAWEFSTGVDQIETDDEALRQFLKDVVDGKAKFGITDVEWTVAAEAIRRRALTFASQSAQRLAADMKDALIKAVNEGLTQQQFIDVMKQKFIAAGIDPASPSYLNMVFRTVTGQSYGEGQTALSTSEAVDPIVWGYQMVANPGLDPHHLYHYPDMHLFAAPKNHQAWVDGWCTVCDFN